MLFNRKTYYKIAESDSFEDAIILLPNTQGDTEEDDITGNTIIHNDCADNLSWKLQQTLQPINMK